MQFVHPEWFNGLWLVLLLGVFLVFAEKRKRKLLKQFGFWDSIKTLISNHSTTKERLKKGLLLTAITLIIFTLAQPQWGEIKKEVRRKGVEIVFLTDTSLSMLAEDTSMSRIDKAKLVMKSFLKQLKGDRVGIVTFAGSGFIQSPLTLDYDAFLLFVNSIQIGAIPDAGTSLNQAIQTAIRAFPDSKQKYHVIVLLSDGEDMEGNVVDAIKMAKEANVRIYAIGIGTTEGGPIPLRSEQGKVSGYKKDQSGNVVITKLNETTLREIAEETGGLYFPAATGGREVEWVYQHMQNIEKKEFKAQMIVEREDHFRLFLTFALLLILIEMFVSEVKSNAS